MPYGDMPTNGDGVPVELIDILSNRAGLDFSIKIERVGNGWSVATEIVDPFRRGYAGYGASLADAWRSQGLVWTEAPPGDPQPLTIKESDDGQRS